MTTFVRRITLPAIILTMTAAFSFSQGKPVARSATPEQTAAKAADGVDIPTPEIKYTKFVLKNGLTLLVHEDHKAPIVAVNTWYHVGSKNEKVGKTGFAHLFEHLMFGGSNDFKHTYINAMEKVGATNLNGTTNNDRTNYFENVPTSMLDYVLFAESDRMGHLLPLDQHTLDLQRGVVQNEKRQGDNQPYGMVEYAVAENTYPAGHPYSWTVIGSMKDLDAASMDDVTEWFKTYYGPNNVTVVIAGDITPAEAFRKVEKYYGEIPAGPPIEKTKTWVAKMQGTHRGWMQDRNTPQSRLYRIWNVPQYGSHTEALLDLAAQVLGRGKTSRLYKKLIYKDQVAIAATATNGTAELGGQFDFTLTAKPDPDMAKEEDNFRRMEKEADEELQNFLKNGPTADELRIAKIQILGTFTRGLERIGGFGGKSDTLARCQTNTGHADCYRDYLQWVKEATPQTVRKAAVDWLSDGDYLLEVHPYPKSYTTSKAIDRSNEPATGAAMNLNLPPMQRTTLTNGLKVVLAERHNAPVVNFTMIVDSGYSADPAGAPGTASFTLRMLEEGTTTRDSLKVAEELEGLSANFNAAATLDNANITMNTLKATMDQTLALYADLLLHPAFSQKEFDRLQNDRVAAIQREKLNPTQMARRVIPALLYGKGHPYANSFTGSGTEDSVKNMTRADLAKFHSTWFKPNNSTLLIVGDTTMNEIKPELEKLFAGWESGNVPSKNITEVPQPAKNVVYLIDRPGSAQSVIFGAQLAPPSNSPDAVAIQIINDIFGGTFSSRINMNLREDKHWSYGASATLLSAQGQRPYISISAVQTDKTRESMAEVMKEYNNISGAKPITPEELKDMQNNDTLSLPGQFESSQQLAQAYQTILSFNLPEDYYNSYTQKAMSLTPETANALAKKIIEPDHLVYVVVGDMAKVEAGIRELNIGEIHKIDADGNPVK